MGGRLLKEGIHAYLELIHAGVQQKLIQHRKAIVLQFEKKPSNYLGYYKKGRQESRVI